MLFYGRIGEKIKGDGNPSHGETGSWIDLEIAVKLNLLEGSLWLIRKCTES